MSGTIQEQRAKQFIRQRINKKWHEYGKNDGGYSYHQFHMFMIQFLKKIGYPKMFTSDETKEFFVKADTNFNKHIDKEELYQICKRVFLPNLLSNFDLIFRY